MYRVGERIYIDEQGIHGAHGSIVTIGTDSRMTTYEHGMFDALRSFEHVGHYYGSIEPSVNLAMHFSRSALKATWFAEVTDVATLRGYESMMASAEKLVRGRSHDDLVKAVEFLERGGTMFDIVNRFNPMSRATLCRFTMYRLDLYLQFTKTVRGEVDVLTAALIEELKRNMMIIMLVDREITELSRWWILDGKVEQIKGDQAMRMAKRLNVCADTLDQVIARPFRQLCYRMARDVRAMSISVENESALEAMDPLRRVLNAQILPEVLIDLHGVTTLTSMGVRWPQVDICEIETRLIVHKTRKVIQSLDLMNDDDFERPVSIEMIHHLLEAVDALGRSDLQAAKDAMVVASHVAAPVAA